MENKEKMCETKMSTLKAELESKNAELKARAEDKQVEKQATEWQLEKEFLEKQLTMAKTQIDDNKKMFESFKSAFDKTSKVNTEEDSHNQAHVLEANKVIYIA